MSNLINLDYGKFFDEILHLDQKIKFVAIYDGHFFAKFRDDDEYFRKHEIKASLYKAQQRWDFCKNQSFKTVAPKFAMTQDGKVNRLTIPLGNGVILLTVELNVDVNTLTDKIIKTHNRIFN